MDAVEVNDRAFWRALRRAGNTLPADSPLLAQAGLVAPQGARVGAVTCYRGGGEVWEARIDVGDGGTHIIKGYFSATPS